MKVSTVGGGDSERANRRPAAIGAAWCIIEGAAAAGAAARRHVSIQSNKADEQRPLDVEILPSLPLSLFNFCFVFFYLPAGELPRHSRDFACRKVEVLRGGNCSLFAARSTKTSNLSPRFYTTRGRLRRLLTSSPAPLAPTGHSSAAARTQRLQLLFRTPASFACSFFPPLSDSSSCVTHNAFGPWP